MTLYTVTNGNIANDRDLDQVINVLQRPAGQQETGKYYLQGGLYATSAQLSAYIRTLSQGSTPVSVSIDTADFVAFHVNAPVVQIQTSYGFSVHTTATAADTECHVGGNWVVNY